MKFACGKLPAPVGAKHPCQKATRRLKQSLRRGIRMVVAENETADDWWLQGPIPDPSEEGGPWPSFPREGGSSLPV